MIRRFTGWHMTTILVAFFGVVIAVNIVMARDAIRTFGGTVVENSYVASQHYDRWLAEARAQDAAGWRADPVVAGDRRLMLAVARGGSRITRARVTVTASHPLGRLPERTLEMRWSDRDGRFVSARPLPAGRWMLHIEVEGQGAPARFDDEIRV